MTTEQAHLLDEDGARGEDGDLAWWDKETERVKGRVSREHKGGRGLLHSPPRQQTIYIASKSGEELNICVIFLFSLQKFELWNHCHMKEEEREYKQKCWKRDDSGS